MSILGCRADVDALVHVRMLEDEKVGDRQVKRVGKRDDMLVDCYIDVEQGD